MKRRTLVAAVLAAGLITPQPGLAQEHWSYAHPEDWAGECQTSPRQSPISLAPAGTPGEGPGALEFLAVAATTRATVRNTGHSIEVTPDGLHQLRFGERVFQLAQFHFHAPSEHLWNGRAWPLEVHFVYVAQTPITGENNRMVVGLFGEESADDGLEGLHRVAGALEAVGAAGQTTMIDLADEGLVFGPAAGGTYARYDGSLTTPPCTPDVGWVVLADPVRVRSDDLAAFRRLYPANARPVRTDNRGAVSLYRAGPAA